MYASSYERPSSLADAARLTAGGAKALAGGQTLLASMKLRLTQPDRIADLGGVKELSAIRKEGGNLVIGAMLRQKASNFPLIGVFVAQSTSGQARVAVTGGGNGVFRHNGLEDALTRSFTPAAAEGVRIDSAGLSSDLHATAGYRANLISVMAQRAVAKALA
jgi:CO/xanthine dehydrogenase FAD-binding subunit